jgi:hypothetical protein
VCMYVYVVEKLKKTSKLQRKLSSPKDTNDVRHIFISDNDNRQKKAAMNSRYDVLFFFFVYSSQLVNVFRSSRYYQTKHRTHTHTHTRHTSRSVRPCCPLRSSSSSKSLFPPLPLLSSHHLRSSHHHYYPNLLPSSPYLSSSSQSHDASSLPLH